MWIFEKISVKSSYKENQLLLLDLTIRMKVAKNVDNNDLYSEVDVIDEIPKEISDFGKNQDHGAVRTVQIYVYIMERLRVILLEKLILSGKVSLQKH